MFQDIDNIFKISVTVEEVIGALIVAFLCGIIVSIFYRITYRSSGFSVSFLYSLVILTMITSIVIITIGDNLARAFGLVGAMSIIRFRTSVKETHDIMFIFFSLGIGMAVGVGLYAVAFVSTVIIGGTTYMLARSQLFFYKKRKYLLQFTYNFANDNEEAPYIPILKNYCKSFNMINMKTISNGSVLELSYYVELRRPNESANFVKAIKHLQEASHVNLYFEDEYI
jgi:uncharacterized membrane protein YhiD involved in acid resistance